MITRRTLLAAAPPALMAVPAALGTPTPAIAEAATSLATLIEAHRSACEARNEAIDRFAAVDDLYFRVRLPEQVQVSRVAETGEPIFAASAAEIEARSQRTFTLAFLLPGDHAAVENRRLGWVANKTAELEALRASNEAEKRRLGYQEADQAVDRALEVENVARVRIVLHRPRDAADAEMRRRYLAADPAFQPQEFACNPVVIDALLRALGVPTEAG